MKLPNKETIQGLGGAIIIIGSIVSIIIWVPKVVLTIVIALIIIIPLVLRMLYGVFLRFQWERSFAIYGKRVLIVYSRSPNWQEHIESRWIKQYDSHIVVFDWSNRSEWTKPFPLPVKVFKYWGGSKEYNPMAILFPKQGRVRVIRFWKAFRDSRHGKVLKLQKAEERLFNFIKDNRIIND